MTIRSLDILPTVPRLPRLLLPAVVAVWPWIAAGEPAGPTSVYGRGAAAAATAPAEAGEADRRAVDEATQAERIFSSSLAMLGRAESFSARLRQKVRIGDRVLVGTGRYVQSGRGEDQRYRFESSLTADSETFQLLEVGDGLFAWTHRHYGSEPPQLERLDIRRVREKLVQLRAPDATTATPYLGGLQRSLAALRQWFRLVTAEPGQIGDTPVWIVDGRWRPALLAALQPDLATAANRPEGIAPGELPDGVPWSVRFCIGRTDLVPYRVEWLAVPGRRPVGDALPEPIAILELQEVRIGGAIDAGSFVYKPAAEGLVDLTESYVATLSLLRQ